MGFCCGETGGKALIVANLLKDDAAGESILAVQELEARGWDATCFSFEGDPSGAPKFGLRPNNKLGGMRRASLVARWSSSESCLP